MSPLWLSAHAHIIYSLIKELFNCETVGIFGLDKLAKKVQNTTNERKNSPVKQKPLKFSPTTKTLCPKYNIPPPPPPLCKPTKNSKNTLL
jgi:hypothetical protein